MFLLMFQCALWVFASSDFLFISNKRPLSEIYGGRLLERGVYRIFLGLYWAFTGEGRLKESGRLLEKIR